MIPDEKMPQQKSAEWKRFKDALSSLLKSPPQHKKKKPITKKPAK